MPVGVIVPYRQLRGALTAEEVGYEDGVLWRRAVTPELLLGIVAVGGTLLALSGVSRSTV